jgi:multidrug efflux pump
VLVSGMTIGTVFTLFVVPVFYSLIAAQRRHETADLVEANSVSPERIAA